MRESLVFKLLGITLGIVMIQEISAHKLEKKGHEHNHKRGHHNCTQDSDPEIEKFYKEFEEKFNFNFTSTRMPNPDTENPFEAYEAAIPKTHRKHSIKPNSTRRNLAGAIMPLRVTLDTTNFDQGQIDVDQHNYIENILVTVQTYLSQLINVEQTGSNNVFPSGIPNCLEVAVPPVDQTTGIANSDLHVYVYHEYNYNSSYDISGQWCNIYQSGSIIRPNFGRLKINLLQFTQVHQGYDKYMYHSDLFHFIHEFIHIMGFTQNSFQYWVNPGTGNSYGGGVGAITSTSTVRGYSSRILYSPHVLETARDYYACNTLNGMQLESSSQSHWERTIIQDELMTAYTVTLDHSFLSVFTIAALKDTGFWDEVNENMAEEMFWGYRKGCNFPTNACGSGFDEFSNSLSCTYLADAQSYYTTEGYMDNCSYQTAYSYLQCTDPYNKLDTYNNGAASDYLDNYTYNSKCFQSSVMNPGSSSGWVRNTRCHMYQCTPDRTNIQISFIEIPSFLLICYSGEQGVTKNAYVGGTYIGQIVCPKNYNAFCSQLKCKNYCAYNGACVRGKCICNAGFSGDDCSLSCPVYSENGVCVAACSALHYVNPDYTCKTTCPESYYINGTKCSPCHFTCGNCTGPSSWQCTSCQLETYLNGSSCTNYCPGGQYGDYPTKTCVACPPQCTGCWYGTWCTSCAFGYTLEYDVLPSQTQHCMDLVTPCQFPCLTCQADITLCTSCVDSYFFDANSQTCVMNWNDCPAKTFGNSSNRRCTPCETGCLYCSSDTSCQICDTANNYRLIGTSCTKCAQECRTCVPGYPDKCATCPISKFMHGTTCINACPDGYYAGPNNVCAQCLVGCLTCITGQECIDCDLTTHYPYTWNNIRICITSSDCFSPCSTCTAQYKPESCLTCDDYFFLQGDKCLLACTPGYFADKNNVCQKCDRNCKTCQFSSTTCMSCNIPYGLDQTEFRCVQPCPIGNILVSQVCTPGGYQYVINTFASNVIAASIYLFLSLLLVFVF